MESVVKYSKSDDDMDSGSEEEESCSSDEDVDEDDDEESDEDEEVLEEIITNDSPGNVSTRVSDGDEDKDYCPICLNTFYEQNLGTPESCDHTFCFECIKEWSKNINTCPIDRTEFNCILVKSGADRKIIKKVKVKVRPKEPENAMEDIVTLCEVCHNGDREDRLLLCDGCDLAYHCECLDPPLYYIPIEEWFCPSCSGIVQNRAFAGPSHSTSRRVIPRTRASEAVRSIVQNRRTRNPSHSRSTSTSSRTKVSPVKKKRRRKYRRAIKKVVQLARTKQSMSNAGKGKVGARGATVVITYRRSKKRRRRRTTKGSTRSSSTRSSKSSKGPSAQTRIAKRLGISKPVEGSSIPQVKKQSWGKGACLGSGGSSKMLSHSLFGDKNQLMDFSENFHEDITNAPSTSGVSSKSKKSPEISQPPSLNILDSIMAGQTILHSKSDSIVIKTDGTLILKNEGSKKITSRNFEMGSSSREPMRVALTKEGVKNSALLSMKPSSKIKGNLSQASNAANSKAKSLSTQQDGTSSSTSKIQPEKNKNRITIFDNEKYKKNTLPTWKVPRKSLIETMKPTQSNNEHSSLTNGFDDDIPSDWEAELTSPVKVKTKNVIIKTENEDSFESVKSIPKTLQEAASLQFSKNLVNNEASSHSSLQSMEKIDIKKEVLSDEESNVASLVHNLDHTNKLLSVENSGVKIKEEPKDSDTESDTLDGLDFPSSNVQDTSESENSDFEASQSLIASNPNISDALSKQHQHKNALPEIKIKKEILSDDEGCSDSVSNISSSKFISHDLFLEKSSQLRKQSLQSPDFFSEEILSQSLLDLPATQVLSETSMSINQSLDDELPATQINYVSFSSKDMNRDKTRLKLCDTSVSSESMVSEKHVSTSLSKELSKEYAKKMYRSQPQILCGGEDSTSGDILATQCNSNLLYHPACTDMLKPHDKNRENLGQRVFSNTLEAEESADLPATQITNVSTSCHGSSDEEFPPTQMNSDFLKPVSHTDVLLRAKPEKSGSKIKIITVSNKNVYNAQLKRKNCSKQLTSQYDGLKDLPATPGLTDSYDTDEDTNSGNELSSTQIDSEFIKPRPPKSILSKDGGNKSKLQIYTVVTKNIDSSKSKRKSSSVQGTSQIGDLTDLPATQVLRESYSADEDNFDELPSTQMNSDFVKPLPPKDIIDKSKSKKDVANKKLDIVEYKRKNSSKQLASQHEELANLPATQILGGSYTGEDNSDDELSSTQMNFDFVNPLPSRDAKNKSKQNIYTVNNKKIHNNESIKKSSFKQLISQPHEIVDLPATQVLGERFNTDEDEDNSDDELPSTQVNFDFIEPHPLKDVKNKSKLKKYTGTNKKLDNTESKGKNSSKQLASQSDDMVNLPSTQDLGESYNTAKDGSFNEELHLTQMDFEFLIPFPLKDISSKNNLIKNKSSNISTMSNAVNSVSVDVSTVVKTKNGSLQDELDELNDLPATQIFHSENNEEQLLSDELPPTQLNAESQQSMSDLSFAENNQIEEVNASHKTKSMPDSESLLAPDMQSSTCNTQSVNKSCSHRIPINKESGSPDIQSFNTTVNGVKEPNTRLNTSCNDSSQTSDPSKTLDNESTLIAVSTPSIKDILSNIKELVSSLPKSSNIVSVRDLKQIKHVCENMSSSNDPDVNLPETNTLDKGLSNSEDPVQENKQINSDNKSNADKLSDSDGEELSPAQLREIAKASKVFPPPKKDVGIHRHLPQVITTKPAKQPVQPKPPNRRTFSFQQVAQKEKHSVQGRDSLDKKVSDTSSSENSNSSNEFDFDELPATQIICFDTGQNAQHICNDDNEVASSPLTTLRCLNQLSMNKTSNNKVHADNILKLPEKATPTSLEHEGNNCSASQDLDLYNEHKIPDLSQKRIDDCTFLVETQSVKKETVSEIIKDSLPSTEMSSFVENNLQELKRKVREVFDAVYVKTSLLSESVTGLTEGNSVSLNIKKQPIDLESSFQQVSKITKENMPHIKIKEDKVSPDSTGDLSKQVKRRIITEVSDEIIKKVKVSKSLPIIENDTNSKLLCEKPACNSVNILPSQVQDVQNLYAAIKTEMFADFDKKVSAYVNKKYCEDKKIEFINEPILDESIPATQVISNFRPFVNDNSQLMQVSFPDSSLEETFVMENTCSDDEISIIEVKTTPKVKEVVLIDDDDDLDITVQNEYNSKSLFRCDVDETEEKSSKYKSSEKEVKNDDTKMQNLTDCASNTRLVNKHNKNKDSMDNCSDTKRNKKSKSDSLLIDSKNQHNHDRAKSKSKFDKKNKSKEYNSKKVISSFNTKQKPSESKSRDCNISNDTKMYDKTESSTVSKEKQKHKEQNSKHRNSVDEHLKLHSEHKFSKENFLKSPSKHSNSKNEYSKLHSKYRGSKDQYSKLESEHRDSKDEYSKSVYKHRDSTNKYSKFDSKCKESKDGYSNFISKPGSTDEHLKKNIKCKDSKTEDSISKCRAEDEHSESNLKHKTSEDEYLKSHSEHKNLKGGCSESNSKHRDPVNEKIFSKHEEFKVKSSKLHYKEIQSKEHLKSNFKHKYSKDDTSKYKKSEKRSFNTNNNEIFDCIPSKKAKNSCDEEKRGKSTTKEYILDAKSCDHDKGFKSKDKKSMDFSNLIKSDSSTSSTFEKDKYSCSSVEKENYHSSNKKSKNEFLISLKPSSTKRKQEHSDIHSNSKKLKLDDSSNYVSCSGNSSVKSDLGKDTVIDPQMVNCDSNDSSLRDSPKITSTSDIVKVIRKQELKEEIANEVKMVLKPYFMTGVITKDNYKEIMRKSVPKIFLNCHNAINSEKIKKLVLGYVSLLNKSL